MSPVGGSEWPIDKVPAGVSVVTATDIERTGSPSITEAINARVPGATINEALGNPLAADLQYRGFSASPLNGTPQGLAIYQNGVRMNEVFGDSMNWDLIPQIAISEIIVMSNNPVYGLNALGGAVNVIMKDGFNFQGATIDSRFGSFGHKEVAAEAGFRSGNWATYVAGEWIDVDGWRELSPAQAKRFYADIGIKGSGAEFHLNYTLAKTFLGVVGPTPVELINESRESVFTSPQSFDNRMHMLNLVGSVSVTDTLKLSGNTYYRSFSQRRPDGNVSEAIACDPMGPNAGLLCFEENDDVLFGRRRDGTVVNVPIASLPQGEDTVLGGNDSVSVKSYSFGGTLQAVSKARLFSRPNQFLVGTSIDLGQARVKSHSELGVLDPRTLVVTGLGIIIDQSLNPNLDPGDVEVTPVDAWMLPSNALALLLNSATSIWSSVTVSRLVLLGDLRQRVAALDLVVSPSPGAARARARRARRPARTGARRCGRATARCPAHGRHRLDRRLDLRRPADRAGTCSRGPRGPTPSSPRPAGRGTAR